MVKKEKIENDIVSMYLNEISKYKSLSRAEEFELFVAKERGDKEAEEKLILSNLKLVVSIAKRYDGFGVPLLDLIQEGNIGLMRALDTFDYKRGYKFSTYATWLIKRNINKAIAKVEIIRIPKYKRRLYYKAKQIEHEYFIEHGRIPSKSEIAKILDVDVKMIEDAEKFSLQPMSLDMPIEEGYEEPLEALLEDETAKTPEQEAYEELKHALLIEKLSSLDTRERRIIEQHYGLFDNQVKTLKKIGEEMGISRERVRQIEKKALEKLKKFLYKLMNLS